MKCTAYLIDVHARTVSMTTLDGLESIQQAVMGYIEAAYQWPTGDVLYVDEEGMDKPEQRYFAIPERPDQALAGNGVLLGREVDEFGNTAPPRMTLDWLRARVRFVT